MQPDFAVDGCAGEDKAGQVDFITCGGVSTKGLQKLRSDVKVRHAHHPCGVAALASCAFHDALAHGAGGTVGGFGAGVACRLSRTCGVAALASCLFYEVLAHGALGLARVLRVAYVLPALSRRPGRYVVGMRAPCALRVRRA